MISAGILMDLTGTLMDFWHVGADGAADKPGDTAEELPRLAGATSYVVGIL